MKPILLVDRRDGFAHALQTVLNHAGYDTLTATTCEEAALMASQIPFTLIIVGDVFGGLLRSTQNLKQNPATRDIPLLLHADDWSVHNEAFLQASAADGVLPYPLAQHDLLQLVADFFPPIAS